MATRSFITGCAGAALSDAERAFLRETDPWGLILFARNCETPDQIRTLVADFRDSVGRADAPVLIDQEGGRVQRLKPPHWPDYPAAGRIGQLYDNDSDEGLHAAWLHGRLIGEDLYGLGITVDCLPCLDIRMPETHAAIGDRSFGTDPARIVALAEAQVRGLAAAGIAPVMKHMPGHGRATIDSHFELPVVGADRDELERTDFAPFRELAALPMGLPMGMTAHVVYEAIDGAAPATLSAAVIDAIIRGSIGFDGLLMSDDLSMQALSGSLGERARGAVAAGCDLALHCNGDAAEMAAVAEAVPHLAGRAAERAATALQFAARQETDLDAARREFEALVEKARSLDPAGGPVS